MKVLSFINGLFLAAFYELSIIRRDLTLLDNRMFIGSMKGYEKSNNN